MRHKLLAVPAFILILLTGCKTSPEKQLAAVSANAPDAVTYLVNELKTKKIIFINNTYSITNEEDFLAEHLQTFYDAGVRYIFSDTRMPDWAIPGHENYFFPMFYPWMVSGWRFEETDLLQTIASLEQLSKDPLIVIPVRSGSIGRENFTNDLDWMNYLDAYAGAKIIETLNNASADAKAIIRSGGASGVKKVIEYTELNGTYVPMGYLLAEHYGSVFSSWYFLVDLYIKPNFEQKWKQSVSGSKIILPKDLAAKDIIHISPEYNKNLMNYYDGVIAQGETHYGTFYQYVPIDENLRFLVRLLKDYELKDTAPNPIFDLLMPEELDSQYLLALYYLKLYYGDHFNYSFWRTGAAESPSLLEALEELEAYSFNENVKPSELINFHYSLEDMREYCTMMGYSALADVTEYGRNIAEIEIGPFAAARDFFPEDIWSLYLTACIQTERGEYTDGLRSFQELFTYGLARCLETLPLAYKKAAKCAAELGNTRLAAEYAALSENLYNEHGIDPAQLVYGKLYK